MDRHPTRQESFIVRVWHAEGRAGWRGWVQHTRSGETAALRSAQELVAFIEQWAGSLEDTPSQGLK